MCRGGCREDAREHAGEQDFSHRDQHELGTPGRTLGFVVVAPPAFGVPPDGMVGTPVATLLGFSPGAVAMPALPGIVPAALDPDPQGRTVPGFTVLAAPGPLAPGRVIVLFPGVGEGGTVGVIGAVTVPPGAAGNGERAAGPTAGAAMSAGIEPALALPVSALNSGSKISGLRRKRAFITGGVLRMRH